MDYSSVTITDDNITINCVYVMIDSCQSKDEVVVVDDDIKEGTVVVSKVILNVEGMTCASCVSIIENTLSKKSGMNLQDGIYIMLSEINHNAPR